jgi:hypothetical protein
VFLHYTQIMEVASNAGGNHWMDNTDDIIGTPVRRLWSNTTIMALVGP